MYADIVKYDANIQHYNAIARPLATGTGAARRQQEKRSPRSWVFTPARLTFLPAQLFKFLRRQAGLFEDAAKSAN